MAMLGTLSIGLAFAPALYAKKKPDANAAPKAEEKPKSIFDGIDITKAVWPNPPAITRIRYISYFSGEKYVPPSAQPQQKKKQGWMDRVAGAATGQKIEEKPRWEMLVASGVAVNSKGLAYVADSKVRAIFIVNPATGQFDMIKNGSDAHFTWLTGLAVDDSDRLFACDSGLHHVLVFNAQHKIEGTISKGLYDPGGVAVDNENRLLYVTDAEQDLVQVYDADYPYTLIRTLGVPGKKHSSTVPGEFSKPTNVTVDKDGNVYVADTWNNRIEIFDADGQFIRAFGKSGDGPGYFARPKGLAIDSDGHVWVADTMQDRVQVFSPDGKLLIWMGGHGLLPGMFQSINSIAIRDNKVYTTEQFPGRMQVFQYITDSEAIKERDRRTAEAQKKLAERRGVSSSEAPAAAKPETAPAVQPAATTKK